MKKALIILMAAAIAAVSCNNNETTRSVGETLSLDNMFWINEPKNYSMNDGEVIITTEEKTDLWQHTLNGADLSNAPILVTKTGAKSFTFTVRTDFSEASTMYDQCGPIIYMDRDNWLKASVENAGEEGYLGSVNNMDGHSDWATSNIDGSIKTVWYRVFRSGCDVVVSSSLDGEHFNILRFTHISKAEGDVCIGIYACSPGDGASFNAKFSDMTLTPGGSF